VTTRWEMTRIWEGETVAILGAGPDMTKELAESARGFKTVAVNRAVKFAPWADLFVALDPKHPFYADPCDFQGIRVCGIECDLDAAYAGMWYYTVRFSDGHTIEIRNNAIAAMLIAERLGAAKLLLLGFDTERYEAVHAHTGFYGLTQALEQLTSELLANGIAVERIDSKAKRKK